MFRTVLMRAALGAALVFGGAVTAKAQEWPTRQVTVLLGLTPGSLTDLGARLFAEVISRNTGQRVLVENRAGAGGILAAQALLNAPADGHTLMMVLSGVQEVLPAMQQMPFDPINDFTYITELFYNTNYMSVPVAMPVNSIAELVEYGKKKPGGLNFGTTALGSSTHLMGALFKVQTGAPTEIIPYKGPAEMITDMVANRLDFTIASYTNFSAALDAKQVKLLAINAPARSPRYPNIPTFAEAGYPGIGIESWFGIAAHAKTPKPLIDKIHAEYVKASRDPDIVKKLTEQDIGIKTLTPEETLKMTMANKERLGKIIKDLNIKSN